MAKRLLTKWGVKVKKGEKVKVTRDTFVKNPRKGKKKVDVKKRDNLEKTGKKK